MMNIEHKTQEYLDKALEDVIQELLIIDRAGVSHLVYVHKLRWDNQGMRVEFSTPDGDKESLIPYVNEAMEHQIQEYARNNPELIPKTKATVWSRVKSKVAKVAKTIFNVIGNIF